MLAWYIHIRGVSTLKTIYSSWILDILFMGKIVYPYHDFCPGRTEKATEAISLKLEFYLVFYKEKEDSDVI